MNLRAFSMILSLAIVVLAVFATLNWTALTVPVALNFGYSDVSAPLGVVMLVFTAAISSQFILYIVLLQAGAILESRRLMKDVKAQRELADTAEASRFTELRSLLEAELRQIKMQSVASNRDFGALVEQSERGIHNKLAEATTTLSAYLGEIEDKLDRVLVQASAQGLSTQARR